MSEIKFAENSAYRQIGRFSEHARNKIMKILEDFQRIQAGLFQEGEIDYDMHMFLLIHIAEIYHKITEGEDNE